MSDPIGSKLHESMEILNNLRRPVHDLRAAKLLESKDIMRTSDKRSGFWASIAKFLSRPPSEKQIIKNNLQLIQKNLKHAQKDISSLEKNVNAFKNKLFAKENLNSTYPIQMFSHLEKLNKAQVTARELSSLLDKTPVLQKDQVQLIANCKSALQMMSNKMASLQSIINPLFQKNILNKIKNELKNFDNDLIETFMMKKKDAPLSGEDISTLFEIIERTRDAPVLASINAAKSRKGDNLVVSPMIFHSALEDINKLSLGFIEQLEGEFDQFQQSSLVWISEVDFDSHFHSLKNKLSKLKPPNSFPHLDRYRKLMSKIENAQIRFTNDLSYQQAKIAQNRLLFPKLLGNKLSKPILDVLPTAMENPQVNNIIESIMMNGKNTPLSTLEIYTLSKKLDEFYENAILKCGGERKEYEKVKASFEPALKEMDKLVTREIKIMLLNPTIKKIHSNFTSLLGSNFPLSNKQRLALLEAIKSKPEEIEKYINNALIEQKAVRNGQPSKETIDNEGTQIALALASIIPAFTAEISSLFRMVSLKSGQPVNIQVLTDSLLVQLVPNLTSAEIGNGPGFRYLNNLKIGKKNNLLLVVPPTERRFVQDGYIRYALNHNIWERSSWSESPPLMFKWTISLVAKNIQPVESTTLLDLSCLGSLREENKKAIFSFIQNWLTSLDSRPEIEKDLLIDPLSSLIPSAIRNTFMESVERFSSNATRAIVEAFQRFGAIPPKPEARSAQEASNIEKNKLARLPPPGISKNPTINGSRREDK